MGLFKKSIKYSKSSGDLEYKIKNLNEDLKKTKVTIDPSDHVFVCEKINADLQNLENQKYDWRKSLENFDIKTPDQLLEEDISQIRESLDKKNNSLRRVETHIESLNEDFVHLRKQIFEEISENFLFNIPNIEQKINKVLQIYDQIQEGLLNEPPNVKNSDPLTPLNQNFITVDDLNKHYSIFINRIQEQLATIGGGGETKLKYLDDVVLVHIILLYLVYLVYQYYMMHILSLSHLHLLLYN
jgi:archaellum component FlaC